MTRTSLATRWRPGLRAGVVSLAAALVVGTAIAVSATVSDHLTQAAIHEAVRTTEALVRGYVDPLVIDAGLANPTSAQGETINRQLASLVSAGKILRIKIWGPDGSIVFSDLPALRGRAFAVDEDLGEALDGEVSTDLSDGSDAENVFERGLADRFLSIYLPIRTGDGSRVIGAYEVYEDAAPIEADVAATRQDVLVIVAFMALGLLVLLYAGFAGASRLLAFQNRRLREQAATEQVLMTDLRLSAERFRSLVTNSADVDMILRADGSIAYEGPAVERVLGYRAEDRIGQPALDIVHPSDRERVNQLLAEVTRSPGTQVTAELRARHADASWRSIEAVFKNLLDDPAVGGVVVNYRDITMRRELEDELRHRAFHDSLTGLANRALFSDRLEHALSRRKRSRRPLAVLFLDLDDFKTVNDSLGHGEGDQLLVTVADRLRSILRAGDTLARMGGDEFAVLIEDATDNQAPVELAERMLATLGAPVGRGGKELFVRASVGVALSGSAKQSADELLRNADAAMNMAKSNGKNRVRVFEPSMHAAAMARLGLKGDLERALDRGEFNLLYQPIMDLRTRDTVGVEALLRWQQPERGTVGPVEFIPVAEETGLIIPLGRWVLEQACQQVAAWDQLPGGTRLTMNVNVSARQVAEPDFVDDVARALRDTGMAAERLVLEFTEGILMHDTESTIATLGQLKGLGVRLAIDDFGTGYSSLSYLRRFPIDVLKVDRSFVATMSNGPEPMAVVRSILKLGETLHLETVAEGIEEAEQLAALRTLGASFGQGYFFARPLDPDAISSLLIDGGHINGESIDRFVA